MRPATFHPAALEAIRRFPLDVRADLGQSIYLLQQGYRLAFPQSRPMPEVGPGVEELRVRGSDGVYRAFYVARFARDILVFHAFAKRSRATPRPEIMLATRRLKEMCHA